jgi:hypothetical protein
MEPGSISWLSRVNCSQDTSDFSVSKVKLRLFQRILAKTEGHIITGREFCSEFILVVMISEYKGCFQFLDDFAYKPL